MRSRTSPRGRTGCPRSRSSPDRTWSAEPGIPGRCQLYSMKLRIEAWSVRLWSTWFTRANGEITSIGRRGPKPQRPCSPASGAFGLRARAALLRGRLPGADRVGVRVGQVVGQRQRRVGHAAVHVVVPAVGVVVVDDHRRALPVRRAHQRVDLVGDERLLVGRLGVRGVAVLVARRLQEADGRQRGRRQLRRR